jgi:hypothetical protein
LPNENFRVEQLASIALAPNNALQQFMEDHESDVFRKEREEIDDILFRQQPLCGDPGLPPGIPIMHTIHDPRKIIVNPHNRVGLTEIHHPLHNEFK